MCMASENKSEFTIKKKIAANTFETFEYSYLKKIQCFFCGSNKMQSAHNCDAFGVGPCAFH